MGLLCIPNTYKQTSNDHPLIKSAHALPSVSGQLYFVHTDSLGTPWAMTDRSATVVWQATYDPFGKAAVNEDPDNDGNLVENNVRFPGQYYDSETGLHYNLHRYYAPEIGRYITSDHVGLFPPFSSPLSGVNHLYLYAGANPLMNIDPLGLFFAGPSCGPAGGFITRFIPDSPFGFNFTSACNNHDSCYAKCGASKSTCDLNFLHNMFKGCKKFPINSISRNTCFSLAHQYWQSVANSGQDLFDDGAK